MEKQVKIKELEPKERLPYIWEYYKLAIIGGVAGILFVAYIIKQIVMPEPTSLMDLMIVNVDGEGVMDTTLFDDFLTDAGYSTDDYKLAVNTNLNVRAGKDGLDGDVNSIQVLYTLFAADGVDAFMSGEDVFRAIAKNEMFVPLDKVADAETIEKYKDQLVYAVDDETGEEYAVGIILKDNKKVEDAGFFFERPQVIGFTGTDEDKTVQKQFLEYMLK